MKKRKILTLAMTLALVFSLFAMVSCNTLNVIGGIFTEDTSGGVGTESQDTASETTSKSNTENGDNTENTDSSSNIEGADNTENTDSASNTEGVDNTENTDSASNTEGADNTENTDSASNTEGADNTENTDSASNTEGADNTENTDSASNTEGADNTENTDSASNTEGADNTENTDSASNTEDTDGTDESDGVPQSVLEAIERSMEYFGQVSGALSVSVDKYENRNSSNLLPVRFESKLSNRIVPLADDKEKPDGGQTPTVNKPILDDIVGMSLVKQMIEQIDMIFAETKVIEYPDGGTYTQYSELGIVYERFTELEARFAEDGTRRIDITDESGKVTGYIEKNDDGSYTCYEGRGAVLLELDAEDHFVVDEYGFVAGSKGDDNPIGYYFLTKYELSDGALKVSYASEQVIEDWYKTELLKYVAAKQYYYENELEAQQPLMFSESEIERLMEAVEFEEYASEEWQVAEYTVKNDTASIVRYTVYSFAAEEKNNYKFMAISVKENDICLQSNFDFVADPYWMTENCGGLPEYREEEGYDWSADYDETFGRIFSEYEALLHRLLLFEGHSGEDPYWQMRFDRDSGEGVLKFVQNWRVEAGGEGVDNYPYPELWTVKGEVDHETVISYMDEIAELWGKEITVITYNFFNIVTDNDNVKM